MILDKYDDLRLILANMMRDDKQCNTLGKGSDNMEKYLQQIVKFFDISVVSNSFCSCSEPNIKVINTDGYMQCDCGKEVKAK